MKYNLLIINILSVIFIINISNKNLSVRIKFNKKNNLLIILIQNTEIKEKDLV